MTEQEHKAMVQAWTDEAGDEPTPGTSRRPSAEP